jgi:excisionase family DNA binding protein
MSQKGAYDAVSTQNVEDPIYLGLTSTRSFTRIARQLGVHRQTVARYVRDHSEPTEASAGPDGPKSTQAPTGSVDSESTQAPRSPASDDVGRSDCEPLREVIEKKLDQGLSAKRIHQDLVEENGFAGSYWSVMRFVRRLGQTRELPFRRLECEAVLSHGSVTARRAGHGAGLAKCHVPRTGGTWKKRTPMRNNESGPPRVNGRAAVTAANCGMFRHTDVLLTAEELAKLLGVRPSTIRTWYRRGRIPGVRLSPEVVRYDMAAVLDAQKPREKADTGNGDYEEDRRLGRLLRLAVLARRRGNDRFASRVLRTLARRLGDVFQLHFSAGVPFCDKPS